MKCIIGLTATATPSTACSLAANLDISGKDIFYNFSMPENYEITASCEEEPKPKEEVGERDEVQYELVILEHIHFVILSYLTFAS